MSESSDMFLLRHSVISICLRLIKYMYKTISCHPLLQKQCYFTKRI